MTSEKQILANRRNAKKSTGPRTAQGQAVASKNSIKHGLLARCDVISSESQADFDDYRRQLLDELTPESPMESMLADRLVTLSWRLQRICRIQNHTIDNLTSPDKPSPLAKLSKSLFLNNDAQTKDQPSENSPHQTLGRMAIKDFSNQRILEKLLMYERRIENSLYKTILEIQRLNILRTTTPQNTLDSLTKQ